MPYLVAGDDDNSRQKSGRIRARLWGDDDGGAAGGPFASTKKGAAEEECGLAGVVVDCIYAALGFEAAAAVAVFVSFSHEQCHAKPGP